MLRSQQGLPMPDAVLDAEAALVVPTTASDAIVCVTSFLEVAVQWKALDDGVENLRNFLDANRHRDYELSRQLVDLASNHPLPESHPETNALEEAQKDLVDQRASRGGRSSKPHVARSGPCRPVGVPRTSRSFPPHSRRTAVAGRASLRVVSFGPDGASFQDGRRGRRGAGGDRRRVEDSDSQGLHGGSEVTG